MSAPTPVAPDTPVSAAYGRLLGPSEAACLYPSAVSPLLVPSKHCTAPGCARTDTVTADGVRGRRCPDHPALFEPAYAVHLAVSGWRPAALAYCRWAGEAA